MYEDFSKEELIEEINSLKQELVKQKTSVNKTEAVELLSKMSHELRTPISTIIGFTNILFEEDHFNSKQMHYIDMINTSTKMVMNLVNDILLYTQANKNEIELRKHPVNPFFKIYENYISIKNIALEKNIDLRVTVDPKISDGCILDDVRMQQVMNNLYTNALKFTPRDGKVVGKVTLLKKSDKSQILRCGIEDSGIGIESDKLKKIFEPFQQASKAINYEYGGTGLGLSISQSILKAMGSQLKVQSKVGVGSFFYFDIEVELNEKNISIKEALAGYKIVLVPSSKRYFTEVCTYLDSLLLEYELDEDVLKKSEKIQESIVIIFDRLCIDSFCPVCEIKDLNKQIIYLTDKKDEQLTCSDIFIIDDFKECNVVLYNVIREFTESKKLLNREEVIEQNKKGQYNASILVAEDYEMNAELIDTVLKSFGIHTEFASNGLEALEKYDHKEFDLILMDLNMPVMDGIEATKQLRKRGCDIPIIALTANVLYEDHQDYISLGFNDILTKPLDKKILADNFDLYLSEKKHYQIEQQRSTESSNINFSNYFSEVIESLGLPLETVFALIEKFVKAFQESLKVIEKAFEKQEYKVVSREVHRLKGSASTLCFHSIEVLCATMYKEIENEKYEHIEKNLKMLKELQIKLAKDFSNMELS